MGRARSSWSEPEFMLISFHASDDEHLRAQTDLILEARKKFRCVYLFERNITLRCACLFLFRSHDLFHELFSDLFNHSFISSSPSARCSRGSWIPRRSTRRALKIFVVGISWGVFWCHGLLRQFDHGNEQLVETVEPCKKDPMSSVWAVIILIFTYAWNAEQLLGVSLNHPCMERERRFCATETDVAS